MEYSVSTIHRAGTLYCVTIDTSGVYDTFSTAWGYKQVQIVPFQHHVVILNAANWPCQYWEKGHVIKIVTVFWIQRATRAMVGSNKSRIRLIGYNINSLAQWFPMGPSSTGYNTRGAVSKWLRETVQMFIGACSPGGVVLRARDRDIHLCPIITETELTVVVLRTSLGNLTRKLLGAGLSSRLEVILIKFRQAGRIVWDCGADQNDYTCAFVCSIRAVQFLRFFQALNAWAIAADTRVCGRERISAWFLCHIWI